jgi:hypothetical protein
VTGIARWAAMGLLTAAATISLTACRDHGLDSAPAGTAPAASTGAAAATGSPSASVAGTAAAKAGQAAQSAQSAALAQVSADLSGVNAGVSQAGTDLGAGDSARTQPDDGN